MTPTTTLTPSLVKTSLNRPILSTKDGSKLTNDKLYTSIAADTIKAKQTNHFQRTRLETPSTDKHNSPTPGAFYLQKITLACFACLCLYTWQED